MGKKPPAQVSPRVRGPALAEPRSVFMSKPKILIFAPREEPPETISALEGIGCEVVFGDRDWQLPRTSARMRWSRRRAMPSRSWAPPFATLRSAGASCRPRSACASSPNTPSASMTSTPRRRPSWASWCAMRRPSPIASASPRPRSRSCCRCSRRWPSAMPTCAPANGARARISPITSAAAPPTAFPARPSVSSASDASAPGSHSCWRPGAPASSPTTPMCRRRIS